MKKRAHTTGQSSLPKYLAATRLAVAAAGVLALTLGVIQGGYQDTLGKAVRICLECIGIG